MSSDEDLERGLQALLDGRPLPPSGDDSASIPSADEPLRVLDALARAHRTAIFGSDAPLDRQAFTMWGHLEVPARSVEARAPPSTAPGTHDWRARLR